MANWSVETLNKQVDEELASLPADMRARFLRIAGLIEEFGPANVGMPHIRSLGRKLWEVRVSGRDGIARGIYVLADGNKIIVLNVFIKKTQQTPEKNLRLAIQRAIKARLL